MNRLVGWWDGRCEASQWIQADGRGPTLHQTLFRMDQEHLGRYNCRTKAPLGCPSFFPPARSKKLISVRFLRCSALHESMQTKEINKATRMK